MNCLTMYCTTSQGFLYCEVYTEILKCAGYRSELLLDVNDPNGFKAVSYPIHVKFTCFKQNDGLLLASVAVLKIVKATEVVIKKRVIWQEKGIAREILI